MALISCEQRDNHNASWFDMEEKNRVVFSKSNDTHTSTIKDQFQTQFKGDRISKEKLLKTLEQKLLLLQNK